MRHEASGRQPPKPPSLLRAFAVRCCLCFFFVACASGAPFEGLAPAQNTGGPLVAFDLFHKPLPAIPLPSDLATRPEPNSPTGPPPNASLIAPTPPERRPPPLLTPLVAARPSRP